MSKAWQRDHDRTWRKEIVEGSSSAVGKYLAFYRMEKGRQWIAAGYNSLLSRHAEETLHSGRGVEGVARQTAESEYARIYIAFDEIFSVLRIDAMGE